jgi:hypothetical protein
MPTVWKGRLTQAAARYGEVAPTATVCCNACRTCVQTNLLAAAAAGLATTGAFIARRLPRFARLLDD